MTIRYRWFEVASTDRLRLVAEYSGRDLIGYYIAKRRDAPASFAGTASVRMEAKTLNELRELVDAASELLELEGQE